MIGIQVAEADRLRMRRFQLVEVERSVLADEHLDHLGSQEVYLIHRMIADQQLGASSFFQNDQDTAIRHQIAIGPQYIDQLNRFVDHPILRDIEQESVLREAGIQRRDTVLRRIRQLSVILPYQFRASGRELFETAQEHALWQECTRRTCGVKRIVDYEIKCRTHARDIALENLVRVDKPLHPFQIHAVIRSKKLVDIRISVLFCLFRRKASELELGKSIFPKRIHHFGTLLINQDFMLLKEVDILLFGFHNPSSNSSLIQSYPRFSSSSASSGPEVFTIRPS